MKKRKRLPFLARQHLFRSEVLRYSLLLLLPLLLSIALFFSVWGVIVQQMNQDGTAVAEHFQARTDRILRETEVVSSAILKDGKFLEYMESKSFDPSDMCALISSKLLDSPYVSSAYLLWEEQGQIYSERCTLSYMGVPSVLQTFRSSVYENVEDYFYDAANLTPGWFVADGGYSPPYYVADAPHGAKLVVISNMRSFLDSIQEPNAAVCCAFNDTVSFSSLLLTIPSIDWYSAQAVSDIADAPVKCFYVEGSNLTYMAAVSTSEYYTPLWIIVAVFSVYFAAVLIVGYLYLHAVSRRRYETAMELLNALPDPTVENPTYQDIMAVATGSLRNYKETHDFAQRTRNREMLGTLLTSSTPPSAAQTASAGILLSDSGFCVARFNILSTSSRPGQSSNSVDLMCRILETTLNSLGEKRISAAATAIFPHYYAVISILDSMLSDAELRGTLRSSFDILEENYGIILSSTVSSRHKNINELAHAREETDHLFTFIRSINSDARLVSLDFLKANTGILLNGDFLNQLQVLSQALSLNKYDMIPRLTASILEEHVAGLRQHYELATDRLVAVSGLLAEAVWGSRHFSSEEKELTVARLHSCRSISDLNATVTAIFVPLAEKTRNSEVDPIVQQACDYIAANLSDATLSVPQICEAMEVSVSYFSRIFKRDTNTTIIDYINSRRIERAKQLLLEGNDTLVLIAEASGFGNTVTFSRNFKRYTGMTPHEYRTMNQ